MPMCAGRSRRGTPCGNQAISGTAHCRFHTPGYVHPTPRHANEQPRARFFFVLPDATGDGWRLSPRGVPV